MYFKSHFTLNVETQSQIDDLTELRDAYRRRLKELMLTAATMGAQTLPHINIEIENIEGKVNEIERTIGRLHATEGAWLARMLPIEGDGPAATPAEIEQQFAAIGRYVFQLEDAVHKEVGGIYHLIETERQIDGRDRRTRQYQTNIFYLSIIFLLCGIFIAVLLK